MKVKSWGVLLAALSAQSVMGDCGRTFPSPVSCVRACPDGEVSAKRLWQGISPQVKSSTGPVPASVKDL